MPERRWATYEEFRADIMQPAPEREPAAADPLDDLRERWPTVAQEMISNALRRTAKRDAYKRHERGL